MPDLKEPNAAEPAPEANENKNKQQGNAQENSGNASSQQGDHNTMTVTHGWSASDLLQVFDGVKSMRRGGKRRSRYSANRDMAQQAMQDIPPEFARANNSEQQDKAEAPTNLEEWYGQFSELERCFLLAMTVLSGAIDIEIIDATEKLYLPIRQKRERQDIADKDDDLEDEGIQLTKAFCDRTYTYMEEKEEGRYIFWKDEQETGLSAFSTRLLDFIVKTSPMGGVAQGHTLQRLEALIQLDGKSQWLVPAALGSLWFKTHRSYLFQKAVDWVISTNTRRWQVAFLLFGAYRFEMASLKAKGTEAKTSLVLDFLEDWLDDASNFGKNADSLINVIIGTYQLILHVINQQAGLEGIEKLLVLLAQNGYEKDASTEILGQIIRGYRSLADFGLVREMLTFLTARLDKYMKKRLDTHQREAKQDQGKEREQQIFFGETFLVAFLSLAFSSQITIESINQGERTLYNYTHTDTLPEHPGLQNDSDMDLLLTGILSDNEQAWRQQVSFLCSVSLFNDNLSLTFELLRNWAEVVLSIKGKEGRILRTSYLHFMVELILRTHRWNQTLHQKGENHRDLLRFPVRETLDVWLRESQDPPKPLSAFAMDLWQQIQPHVTHFA